MTHTASGHNSDTSWLRSVVRLNPFAEALSAAFWNRFPTTITPIVSGRENKNKDKRTKWFTVEGFNWALFVASPSAVRKAFKRQGSVFSVSIFRSLLLFASVLECLSIKLPYSGFWLLRYVKTRVQGAHEYAFLSQIITKQAAC